MNVILDVSKAVAAMPLWSLVGVVMLAGFGLAAYAIYAVLQATKGRG